MDMTWMTQPARTGEGGGPRPHVEVVELERIPPSSTILASYEVETDEQGNVLAFRNFRRYQGAIDQ